MGGLEESAAFDVAYRLSSDGLTEHSHFSDMLVSGPTSIHWEMTQQSVAYGDTQLTFQSQLCHFLTVQAQTRAITFVR